MATYIRFCFYIFIPLSSFAFVLSGLVLCPLFCFPHKKRTLSLLLFSVNMNDDLSFLYIYARHYLYPDGGAIYRRVHRVPEST